MFRRSSIVCGIVIKTKKEGEWFILPQKAIRELY